MVVSCSVTGAVPAAASSDSPQGLSAAPSVDVQPALAGGEFSTSAPPDYMYPDPVCDPDCSESDPCCASDSCSSEYPDAYPVDGSCCFMWHGDCHKCCHAPPPPPPPAPVPADECCPRGMARAWPMTSMPWNSWAGENDRGGLTAAAVCEETSHRNTCFGNLFCVNFAKCCQLLPPKCQQWGPHKCPPGTLWGMPPTIDQGVAQDPHCPAVCSPPSDPSVCKSGAGACDDACDSDGCYGSSWSSNGGRASCSCLDSNGGTHQVCSV